MEKRLHHYVPRRYLQNFVDERVKPPYEPYLWFFDTEKNKCMKKSPKNIGFRNGLYDLCWKDGQPVPIIEDFFAKVESDARPVYEKIINQAPMSADERVVFSYYVYFTLARVPNYLNFMTWFHRNADRYPSLKKPLDKEDLIFSFNYDSYRSISDDDLYTLEVIIEQSQVFASIINQMHWQFLISPKGRRFVTSDNPVILQDPTSSEISLPCTGWNLPNVQLTFPLSPFLCLKATWMKVRRPYKKVDTSTVEVINFVTTFFATNLIFSSRPIKPPLLRGVFSYNTNDSFYAGYKEPADLMIDIIHYHCSKK